MSSVVFECSQCGGSMEVEQGGLRGRLVGCPHCEAQVQVPEFEEGAPVEEDAPYEDMTPAEDTAPVEAPADQASSEGGLAPGSIIRNIYRIDRLLGETSLGEVYVATITTDNRKVQLEIIDGSDQETIDRLSREIELLASMEHPNVVRAFDAGQDGNIFFLASEHEDGDTLRNIMNQGVVPEVDALGYTGDICKALDYAWEHKKIIHRDVKPDNIFVTTDGKAKLMGFGIAKSNEGQSMGLTGVGFTIGTPEYMSPEQIKAEGNLDFHTDMYSLGCVLHEMVTGQLPFDETAPILLMQKHMDEDPVPANEINGAVSQGCVDIISAMMVKDAAERPETWELLIDAIETVKAGGSVRSDSEFDEGDSGEPSGIAGLKTKLGCSSMFGFAACMTVGLGTALYKLFA